MSYGRVGHRRREKRGEGRTQKHEPETRRGGGKQLTEEGEEGGQRKGRLREGPDRISQELGL